MDLEKAIKLAHWDRDGYPLNPLVLPAPSVSEALVVIRKSLRACKHTWLTGEAARDILIKHINDHSRTDQPSPN